MENVVDEIVPNVKNNKNEINENENPTIKSNEELKKKKN